MLKRVTNFFVTTEVIPGKVIEGPKEEVVERSTKSTALKYLCYLFGSPSVNTEEKPFYRIETEINSDEIETINVPSGHYRFETETQVYVMRNRYFGGITKGERWLKMINPNIFRALPATENEDPVLFAKRHLVSARGSRI